MSILTNPLFGLVAFLLGTWVGYVIRGVSQRREWAQREQLIRASYKANSCWVKAQVDAPSASSDLET